MDYIESAYGNTIDLQTSDCPNVNIDKETTFASGLWFRSRSTTFCDNVKSFYVYFRSQKYTSLETVTEIFMNSFSVCSSIT